MRRLLAAALVLAWSAGAALAGAYGDFGNGIEANNRGDADTAIAAFTRAITAGDLASSYLPSAYLGRARAYLQKNECTAARSDLDLVINLRGDLADGYRLRADADTCLGDQEAALKDAGEAIALKPAPAYYFTRARLLWDRGNFLAAASDAAHAVQGDRNNPYYLLWTAVIGQRTGGYDRETLARRATGFDAADWPRALLDLYSGGATPTDVYRAAARGLGRTPANQKCEADFYVGEWRLAQGDAAAAKSLVQAAVHECPRDYVAYQAAQAELKRLQWAGG